jgi:hypothetical protein
MREVRDDRRFAVKARERLAVLAEVTRENLHRDLPAEPYVLGDEHGAHPALVEYLQKSVRLSKDASQQGVVAGLSGCRT